MATFIPNARQQFTDANGVPLAGGSVGMYIPTTLVTLNTWQDAAQTTLNPNPIPLDLGGFATIYGSGSYRQIVKDSLGNTVYDRVVSDILGAREAVNLRDYGAVGNGTTDDSAAIGAAIAANPNKRIVGTPGATYLINSQISITAAPVTLDFTGTTILLGTQNMNGIVIGDGSAGARTATTGTKIFGPTFNVKAGVAAFTTGSCIYRNNVAFVNVYRPQIYGRDGTTTKLWAGIYDYMASECDTVDPIVQYVLEAAVHCKGDGTTPGRTVDCNYDGLRATNCLKGIFIDAGCAGLGFYRPEVYSIAAGGYGLHINCTSGPNGQNFFIDTPDIEATSALAGIFLESGGKAIIQGGWVGANMGFGLKIGASFDSAVVSCNFVQSKVEVNGQHNTISGGEIVGDSVTVADGLTIKGNNTTVSSGVKIRQWAGNGIGWGGVNATNVMVGDVAYANNATDIAPLTGFTTTTAPIILRGATDKVRTGAAAATITVPHSFMQFTGATTITAITLRTPGTMVTIQAGAGGLTFSTAGNLAMTTTPMTVAAFQSASFVCDGANWFLVGKS